VAFISEADVETLVLRQLDGLGYTTSSDADIGPDGRAPEREAYADVILVKRLVAAIVRLNPSIPADARGDALRKVLATEMPALVAENRRLHKLMVEGVDVEFYGEDGTIRGDKVRLIDFDDLTSNDWVATGQFTVINGGVNRRPDIVVFVNGLPLGVIELKAPGGENATLSGAHNQLQTYFRPVPNQRGIDHLRWVDRPRRLADRRSGAVHAVAHDRWQGDRRKGETRTGDPDRGHLRQTTAA
jgi:type I restriction enzyme R subunit